MYLGTLTFLLGAVMPGPSVILQVRLSHSSFDRSSFTHSFLALLLYSLLFSYSLLLVVDLEAEVRLALSNNSKLTYLLPMIAQLLTSKYMTAVLERDDKYFI